MPVRVKICCMRSLDEANLAIAAGASAIGLVSAMPSGPGPISEAEIAAIAPRVPPPIATFLLTCCQDVNGVIRQLRHTHCNTVQLVDAFSLEGYARLRIELPNVRIVQVIHVEDERAIDVAKALESHVDALLLDSGRPNAAVKEFGGTGRVHDWSISARICRAVSIPVFLAGGLNAENVGDALRQVWPFGIDLCSGVRTHGHLDPAKLSAFISAAAF